MSRFYLFSRRAFAAGFRPLACVALLLFAHTAYVRAQCSAIFMTGCTSTGVDINSFQLNGESGTSINDVNTACSSMSWGNFTSESVTLYQGSTYPITINSNMGPANVQVYIDFSGDGNFVATESVGGTNGMAISPGTTNFNITIPATAATGSHFMRVIVSGSNTYPSIPGCATTGPFGIGEAHDYTVVITPAGSTCGAPSALTASSITSSGATISWTAGSGAAGYQYSVNVFAADPAGGTNTLTTSAVVSGLAAGTTYVAHVRDSCGPANFSVWVSHNFVTAMASCTAVSGLTAGSITSTGATLSWTAVPGSAGYQYVVNTSSADPTISGTTVSTATAPVSGLSPATVYYAHVRDSCGPGDVSAWVSYVFTTLSAGGCGAVSGLTASAVTNTSASISWTAVGGSMGYQYFINTTAAAPTGSGTATMGTSTAPAGLMPSTVYYAHVRDSCGVGNLSAWVTTSFTTTATAPSCMPAAGLASSGVTSHGATIAWTAATGVAGYKYVINTTAADPTVPGTFTTLNSTPVTGLSSGTTYYAHVRDSCGTGNVSAWSTVSFNTLAAVGVAGIQLADGLITAYPNPVKARVAITINGPLSGNATIQLTDISGKLMQVLAVNASIMHIDMAGMPSGMYIVRYTDAQHTEAIKIIK